MHNMHFDNPFSTTYIHLSTYSTALEEEGHSALVLYNMTCTLYIHVKHAEMFLANAIFKLHENSRQND